MNTNHLDKVESLRVLYVGALVYGSTALHRRDGMAGLGCKVTSIDSTIPYSLIARPTLWNRVLRALLIRTNRIFDWKGENRKILKAATQGKYDLLWLDKGLWVKRSTLLRFRELQPHAKIANYSPDDMFNPANRKKDYIDCLPEVDCFVTTKSYGVSEFLEAGAKDAFFVGNAYEPSIHRPVAVTAQDRRQWGCDVCFVGAPEPARNQSIEVLAAAGVKLGLYGGDWRFLSEKYPNVQTRPGFIAGELYAKVLCCSKIALGFLRKQNRDLQTQRSVEIPATGTFMLAERSEEHQGLFKEAVEAEYFDTDTELLNKVDFYLNHESRRKEIAAAGQKRCLADGYSNAERIRSALEHIFDLVSPIS